MSNNANRFKGQYNRHNHDLMVDILVVETVSLESCPFTGEILVRKPVREYTSSEIDMLMSNHETSHVHHDEYLIEADNEVSYE